MELGGPSSQMLMKLLSASTLRHKVIGHNIANQNVPGYKRQEVRFEDLVSESLARGARSAFELEPEVVVDTVTPGRSDGNNVTMEDEMSAMRENRIMYELYASILTGRMSMIRSAIHESR